MEKDYIIQEILNRVPQPGFLVKEDRIVSLNQAATALQLCEGDMFSPLLADRESDFTDFSSGQLYLSLSINGIMRSGVIARMEEMDLVLLDPDDDIREFRSMALVSMELRQPLSRLSASVERLLEEQSLTGDNASRQAAQINRNLMQLTRLICNLSDVSRYTQSSHMETRDVDSFLLSLFERAEVLTASRDIRLTYEGLKQPVFSLIDPEQLERAVWNILSNSVKFTPQGGTIQAKLTRRGSRLLLSVLDSGSGIAERIQENLFRRYQRTPDLEDSRYGLGLGMVLLRTAATNHGGTVLVDQPQGAGTRITLTLSIRESNQNVLRSPVLLPDYTGGWDHGLLELSDCLPDELYKTL